MTQLFQILLAAMAIAIPVSAQAQAPVITSLGHNGQLTWSNSVADSLYRVEWSPSLASESWTNSWTELTGIEASSNSSITVAVPMFYRVVMVTNWVPEGMIEIDGGMFQMGDLTGDSDYDDLPVHTASLSRCFISKYEVTKELWDQVNGWAITNGYHFENAGVAAGPYYPISSVSWHDCIKWCNARSEMESLEPIYYTSATMVSVYKTNTYDLVHTSLDLNANGYRLPTEAQWEMACRAGTTNKYYCGNDEFSTIQYMWNDSNSGAQSHEIGQKLPNALGLHDMGGNVAEWCWDRFHPDWYASPESRLKDTLGPVGDFERVIRGGSFNANYEDSSSSSRYYRLPLDDYEEVGFRCVRMSLN